MTDSEGRVVVITGASRGIGAAMAQRFAMAGDRVALVARTLEPDPRYPGTLQETLDSVLQVGGTGVAVQADLSRQQDRERLVAEVEAQLGPIDVLVNNAGVASPKWIVDTTEADYDMIMDTNAKGMWLVAQEVGRRMIGRKKGGQIVIIASMGGLVPTRHLAAYGMSKAAAIHMTKAMALEWARHDINVNAICPGYVSTEMNSEFFASDEGKKFVATFLRRRLMEPRDLDAPLLLLASGTSRAMTGSIIACDDGQGFTLY